MCCTGNDAVLKIGVTSPDSKNGKKNRRRVKLNYLTRAEMENENTSRNGGIIEFLGECG